MEWSKTLEMMLTVDQLDAFNLASAELIVRNLQRIEERYKDKILGTLEDMPGSESLQFTSSSAALPGGLIIDPALTKFYGEINSQRYQRQKEERKAREERALARKPKKDKKNPKEDD